MQGNRTEIIKRPSVFATDTDQLHKCFAKVTIILSYYHTIILSYYHIRPYII